MRATIILTSAAALAMLLSACGGTPSITSHGTVTVLADPGNGQTAQDAYPDIADGGQVTIMDASGKVIGTGTLSYSSSQTSAMLTKATAGSGLNAGELKTFVAEYDFTATVPGGQSRYGIKVGQNRGTVYETAGQMKDPSLTIGSLTG
jgi:hypothetical protein